ncbi:ImmA/IrrE family metallo-endopeptidase [Clostridium carboxidivorans]|uniref:ImmA/IrrE family metallo-endopeptidase n=1 Tax=Clostridium carboxidivorans TaxID=217159 RepID=UPI000AD07309|nr:ImmA/IrrE family metallo-endopeptidase [Clostridium carboxidivorans]
MKNIIDKTVKKLIKKYNTRDPFELTRYLNIKVLQEPLGKHIKGFYQLCPKNKVIHINQDLEDAEKTFICSHELGHALLHTKLNILFLERNTFCVKNRYEIEANTFASCLMIKDDLVQAYPDYFTLEQIAASENLPVELLKLKFNI